MYKLYRAFTNINLWFLTLESRPPSGLQEKSEYVRCLTRYERGKSIHLAQEISFFSCLFLKSILFLMKYTEFYLSQTDETF